MESLSVFEVLKKVIFSWQVIVVTVVLVLYLNLVFYVTRMRRISPKIGKISIIRKKPKSTEMVDVSQNTKATSTNDELGLEEE